MRGHGAGEHLWCGQTRRGPAASGRLRRGRCSRRPGAKAGAGTKQAPTPVLLRWRRTLDLTLQRQRVHKVWSHAQVLADADSGICSSLGRYCWYFNRILKWPIWLILPANEDQSSKGPSLGCLYEQQIFWLVAIFRNTDY